MYHDHNPIVARSFTWNAAFSIQEEAESLRASVEGFRDDFIQSLREDESTSANAELIAELEASVEEILSMVDCAQLLVTQGQYYEATKMLDTASNAFEDLLERVQEAA
ncbi:MAG: hypothetical protein ACREBU_06835 [Nitrososphaera sp.]